MKLEPYSPRTAQSFWCTKCDAVAVDSTKPETGSFHLQYGHAFNPKTSSYDGEGEYLGVMFAVCKSCNEEKAS